MFKEYEDKLTVLILAVALVCFWLGYQLGDVEARQELEKSARISRGF